MSKRRNKTNRPRGSKPYRYVPINEHVSQAAPEEVLRAMSRLPKDLDWEVMAPNVVPVLPRRRPMPPDIGNALTVLLPPGIPTGFGIDIGPAVMHIGHDLLASWGIEPGDVATQALENLGRKTASARPRDLFTERIGETPVRTLQSGWGWASTLVLLPDELVRIFGPADQVLVAPVRDLLMSAPADTDPGFLAWLRDEFGSLDPNALAVEAFALRRGQLSYVALERDLARA